MNEAIRSDVQDRVQMSVENNSEYYAARANAALSLAEQATDPAIAGIHRKMAEEYKQRAALDGDSTALKQVRS